MAEAALTYESFENKLAELPTKESMSMILDCSWTNTDTNGKIIFPNPRAETLQMNVTMVVRLNASPEIKRLLQLR